MNERKRLYPTVKEERQRKELKRQFGLDHTAIGKGGGMPNQTRQEKMRPGAPRGQD